MPSDPSPDYPRPALRRDRWTDLCGTWQFTYDDSGVGVDERWFSRPEPFSRTIEVPYPPESPASGIGDPSYHPVVWYRRTFVAPQGAGEHLMLHFGAVDYRASVWVNGSLAATHVGGHTPFSAEISSLLVAGDEQVITVRAEDAPTDLTQPRGKQDWRPTPHNIWYERTTGIWQPVWLEPVSRTRIEAVRWTPDLGQAQLQAAVRLHGDTTGLRLRIRLTLHGYLLTDDTSSVAGTSELRHIPLDRGRIAHDRGAYLWSPTHPNLLEATVTLLRDDEVVDEVGSHVGLRSVDVHGGRFRLNGRATVLRMVLAQNYWPDSHLAAPSAAAIKREVELVKELGFTGVRIHQKAEDPRFVYWCDVLGVMVWTEMPSPLEYSPEMLTRLTEEWLQVVERDASAPSIVAWVPFNESWGVPDLQHDTAQQHAVRALYSLTKALDPTRVVIANDGWEHLVSDIFGVHDYVQDGAVLRERYGSRESAVRTMRETQPHYRSIVLEGVDPLDAPLMITEFGGATYDAKSDDFWNGYGDVSSPEELADRYADLVGALLDSPAVAGFCYTQLTDTAQERNGLLYEDRRPKIDPSVVAAANQRSSAAVPADAIAEIQIVHAAGREG